MALFVRPLGKGTSGVNIINHGAYGLRIGTDEHAMMIILAAPRKLEVTAGSFLVSEFDLKPYGKTSDWGKLHILSAHADAASIWQVRF